MEGEYSYLLEMGLAFEMPAFSLFCLVPENIKKYKFKTGVKPEVELMRLETLLSLNRTLLTNPHRTNFYHIFLFENCRPCHLVDFSPVNISPHTLLFLDKEMVQQFDWVLPYKGRLLIFTDNFFCITHQDIQFLRAATLFNTLLSGRLDIQPGEDGFKKFVNLFNAIQDELALPPDSAKQPLLKNLVHNVLLLIEREKRLQDLSTHKNGADMNYTLLFRDLLEQEFMRSKKVQEYAAKLNISEKRLGQSTALVLGKSPKELIAERVLLEAKRLLIHASISVKEIGFQLGFDETTNFIKFFRKHTLTSPVEFRRNHLSTLRS